MGRISVGGVGEGRTFQAKAQSLIIGEDAAHEGILRDKLVKEGRRQNMEDFELQAQIRDTVRDKHAFFLNTIHSFLASQKPQAAEYFRVIRFTYSCT